MGGGGGNGEYTVKRRRRKKKKYRSDRKKGIKYVRLNMCMAIRWWCAHSNSRRFPIRKTRSTHTGEKEIAHRVKHTTSQSHRQNASRKNEAKNKKNKNKRIKIKEGMQTAHESSPFHWANEISCSSMYRGLRRARKNPRRKEMRWCSFLALPVATRLDYLHAHGNKSAHTTQHTAHTQSDINNTRPYREASATTAW